MDSHAWLKGDSYDRPHPSRMAHDVDISAGYMHSGYPVSAHAAADAAVTGENCTAAGPGLRCHAAARSQPAR